MALSFERLFTAGCPIIKPLLQASCWGMSEVAPIKAKVALEVMNQKDDFGNPMPFQLAFYPLSRKLTDFKRIVVHNAVRCGLPRSHQSKKDLVGVRPLTAGKHIYSVSIRLITELNGVPVIP